jgi:ribose transport system ATP-binding protein
LTPNQDTPVRQLSGGNQQKVVLGKWLSRESALYILDEPTVGVDIGAKTEIYRIIGELASQGAAILILSSDLLELLSLTDRILVFFRGKNCS